jgi:hypothetical protein
MKPATWVTLAGVVALGSGFAPAQPLGDEFRVTWVVTSNQTEPAVARGAGGGFVVTWTMVDGDENGILGRVVSGSGAFLADFRSNTYTTGNQSQPAVSSAVNGDFVVVWRGAGPGGDGIHGKRHGADGFAVSNEFQINVLETQNGQYPDVAVSPTTGNFLVIWESGADIWARPYNSAGQQTELPFIVNTYRTGIQTFPRVAASGLGYVVVWSSTDQPGDDSTGVYAQRLSPSGTLIGPEFHVNEYTTGFQDSPDVGAALNGSFVIVWRGSAEDGSSDHVRGRRYGTSGVPLAGSFRVNTYTTGSQSNPAVAIAQDGVFTVVWHSFGQGGAATENDIYGQRYAPAGAPLGGEFRVNQVTQSQQLSAAIETSLTPGRYLVAWTTPDGDGNGISARIFCLHGDVNLDGAIDVLDVFRLINELFAGQSPLIACSDVNADAATDVLDVFYLINHLFAGGPAPL